jgi:hypothetical protein
VLTNAERSKATSAARSRLRVSPGRPFVDVVNDVVREATGMRAKGSVEDADRATQVAWFEVAGIVAGARVDLLQGGGLRGLVDDLRALAGMRGS